MKRYILFYAINGKGLGHLTRLLAIARKIQQSTANIVPVFFTSSEASDILYQYGIPCFKVPSKQMAGSIGFAYKEWGIIYKNFLSEIIHTIKPEAIVVDTTVNGSYGELSEILKENTKVKKVFIHREQKSQVMTPEIVNLQNSYDLIIAPHSEGGAEIPVPDKNKLFWSGEILIRDRKEVFERNVVKKMFNLPTDRNVVYVNFGGGGDMTAVSNYKQVFSLLSKRSDIHIVITQAPLSRTKMISARNCTVINWFPVIELMNGFDFAISAAGYNTYNELLYCGIPAIFIPKDRQLDDQHKRALLVEEYDAGICLKEEQIEKNLTCMLDKLAAKRHIYSENAIHLIPHNGADAASHKILDLLR